MIEVQVERDIVVEAYILCIDREASGLISGGVDLPGLNSLGSQISSLASQLTGGAGGSFASTIAGLGTSMASGPKPGRRASRGKGFSFPPALR